MPYSSGSRLPGESASKLGHLAVLQSDWVRSLVDEFESTVRPDGDASGTLWQNAPVGGQPLRSVWAVDGSFVPVRSDDRPPREVSFVKTALLTLDKARLDEIDRDHPHPLLLQDIMANSAIFHATVLPLKNVKTPLGSNYDAVRNIIRDSMKVDEGGAFYETLKWLAYRKWRTIPTSSPSFACPHCHSEITNGLPSDSDQGICNDCKKPVFLTDMIGFHLDMDEDSAPDSVASAYMLVMEHLMLFTAVRILWSHSDRKVVSDSLFIKDGPLTLRGQYSKLVPNIREFLQLAQDENRPVHIIGQEKSGAFFDHLASIASFAPPEQRGEKPTIAPLSHGYVRREVYRSPDLSNPYGMKTNWGEKAFVKFDPGTFLVLNIPTGEYDPRTDFPYLSDLIGVDRIMATLPALISHKFEGALFPVELANGIASMSSYPSARILQRFLSDSSA
jgi:hypothetical protein